MTAKKLKTELESRFKDIYPEHHITIDVLPQDLCCQMEARIRLNGGPYSATLISYETMVAKDEPFIVAMAASALVRSLRESMPYSYKENQ